jgi:hypothetical protein
MQRSIFVQLLKMMLAVLLSKLTLIVVVDQLQLSWYNVELCALEMRLLLVVHSDVCQR